MMNNVKYVCTSCGRNFGRMEYVCNTAVCPGCHGAIKEVGPDMITAVPSVQVEVAFESMVIPEAQKAGLSAILPTRIFQPTISMRYDSKPFLPLSGSPQLPLSELSETPLIQGDEARSEIDIYPDLPQLPEEPTQTHQSQIVPQSADEGLSNPLTSSRLPALDINRLSPLAHPHVDRPETESTRPDAGLSLNNIVNAQPVQRSAIPTSNQLPNPAGRTAGLPPIPPEDLIDYDDERDDNDPPILMSSAPVNRVHFPNDMVALKITPLKDKEVEIASITQLLNSLGGVVSPLCLELSGTSMHRMIVVRCKNKDVPYVQGQITGIYSNPNIEEISGLDDPAVEFEGNIKPTKYGWLKLNKSEALPLRTYRELIENDTIMPILSAFYGLQEEEAGIAQVIIHDHAPANWAKTYSEEMIAIKRKQTGIPSTRNCLSLVAGFSGAVLLAIYFMIASWVPYAWMLCGGIILLAAAFKLFNRSNIVWTESMEDVVMRKIEQPGYVVEIRLGCTSPSEERAEKLLLSLAGSYRVFSMESGNAFSLTPGKDYFDPEEIKASKHTMILGDQEIATLWHLPVSEIPDMVDASRVDDTLPDPSIVSDPRNGWLIGTMGKSGGKQFPVYLPQESITQAHGLLLGRTRIGKTTMFKNAILQACIDHKRAVLVMDPHDDMINQLLDVMPADRIDDVMYIDFTDTDMIPGFNLLDINMFDGDAERTAAAVTDVAHSLYGKYWGPRMEVLFERAIMSLCLANTNKPAEQQYTIIDTIHLLKMGNDVREKFLKENLPDSSPLKATLIAYFRDEFAELSNYMAEAVLMPVLSKLRPFESNSILLNVFGVPKSTFNPNIVLREKKIILIKTGLTISQDFSQFIGSFFLNVIYRCILAQVDMEPQDRGTITLFVDEAQTFAGFNFPEAESRTIKFGGNFFLATQGEEFMGRSSASDQTDDPQTFQKIMSNTDTLVVFRVSGKDAVALCDTEFVDEREPRDLIYLRKHHAFVRFTKGIDVIGPFMVKLNPPPAGNSLVEARIMAGRNRYCHTVEEASRIALQTRSRILGLTDYITTVSQLDRPESTTFPGSSTVPTEQVVQKNKDFDSLITKPGQEDTLTRLRRLIDETGGGKVVNGKK